MIHEPRLTARAIADALGRALCSGVYGFRDGPDDDVPPPPEIRTRIPLPRGGFASVYLDLLDARAPLLTDCGTTIPAVRDVARLPNRIVRAIVEAHGCLIDRHDFVGRQLDEADPGPDAAQLVLCVAAIAAQAYGCRAGPELRRRPR
jgi:hypothetical protein